MLFLKIAWKNVLRRPTRTAITVSAIGLGLAFFVLLWSLADGLYAQLINNSIGFQLGHLQINATGFRQEYNPKIALNESDKITDWLEKDKRIKNYSKRIETPAFLYSATGSMGILLTGINPSEEAKVTVISRTISAGDYLDERDERSILIGKYLAENLGVDLGEKLIVTVSAADGTLAQEAFRVKGIFNTGVENFDKSLVFITLASAQRILTLEKKVSTIAVVLKEGAKVEEVEQDLKNEFGNVIYDIRSWKEIMPIIVQMIDLFNLILYLVLEIVFVVMAIGVSNTILMSVIERTREFGMLMAIGTSGSRIVKMVIFESIFIGIIGIIIGNAIGIILILAIGRIGIDLSLISSALRNYPGLMRMVYPVIVIQHLIIPSLLLLLVNVLVSLYPSVKAARLKPMEAIRFI